MIPAYVGEQRVTALRVLWSEWTKLRSLPSTVWSMLTALTLVIGIGAGYSMIRVTRPPADPSTFDAAGVSLTGVSLAQLAIGVLGVLLMSGEYATGSIRVSLAAVPRRLDLLWGKAVTFGLSTLVLFTPASVVAFVVGQRILAAENLDLAMSEPGVPRAVLGSALFLTVVGVLGLGLGTLLRSTAGAIGALFGLLFAPQLVLGFLPESVSDALYKYIPAAAGQAITFVKPDEASLPPWGGFAVFCGYAALALALGAWRLRTTDA